MVVSLKHVPGEQEAAFTRVPPTLKMAVTAFLQLENVEAGLRDGRLEGKLALYTNQESTSVSVGGRMVPLEFGLTSALAYTLEGSQAYALELNRGCFRAISNCLKIPPVSRTTYFSWRLTVPAGFRWCSFTERLPARRAGRKC
jgi:hypothetical protein